MNINDFNALVASGQLAANVSNAGSMGTSVGGPGQQLIVVNPNNQGGCLPCDQAVCPTISNNPTTNFDLGGINGQVPSCVQFDVVNGGEGATPRYLTFGGPQSEAELPIYNLASSKFFSPATNAFGSAGFTTNDNANALDVQYQNTLVGQAGALVCSIELNINTTLSAPNLALSQTPITVLSIPIDPQNGTCGKTDYAPFCSACVTTNRDGFFTSLYTLAAPMGIRSSIAILFPALSSATVRICYSLIGIENHALADAQSQF